MPVPPPSSWSETGLVPGLHPHKQSSNFPSCSDGPGNPVIISEGWIHQSDNPPMDQ